MKGAMKKGMMKSLRTAGKCVIALVLCLLLPAASISAAASSKEEFPDRDRKGSLTITYTVNGEPISGGNKVGIFKVASVIEKDGFRFVVEDPFKAIGELPEDLDTVNKSLAEDLAYIAKADGIELYRPSQELDSTGTAVFDDLDVGLYLVVQTLKTEITLKDKSKVVYTINPFLVSIPQKDNGKLIYDVSTNPKVAPVKEMVPPPTPPDLPQTGQLWWPVIALGTAGMVFIMIGLIRNTRAK